MRNFAAVSVGERAAVASRYKVRLWLECAASTSLRPGCQAGVQWLRGYTGRQ